MLSIDLIDKGTSPHLAFYEKTKYNDSLIMLLGHFPVRNHKGLGFPLEVFLPKLNMKDKEITFL